MKVTGVLPVASNFRDWVNIVDVANDGAER
jgi:hypothetical protein